MKIGGLCEGYGGLTMGVQTVLGGELVWYCEYDKHPSAILAHRFPGVPNYGDVNTTDWASVESIDVLTAGYPCQPFSGNGNRKGTDDPRHLWPGVLRAIHALRPRVVVLENVEDHLTMGFGDVLADLAEARFDAEWCVLRASDVGAPHGRPRLFIVATDARSLVHAATQPRVVEAAVRAEPTPPGTERVDRLGLGHDADQSRPDPDSDPRAWGEYRDAIERWGSVLGRTAPDPLLARAGDDDIDPRFVEWAMGLPAGWVTDVPGIPVGAQLKALGNGVVPQQAAAALRILIGATE